MDLQGKGIVKPTDTIAKAKAKPKAKCLAQHYWDGEHPHFGKIHITKKLDVQKNIFAALVLTNASGAAGGQLRQASALSVKCNFELGVSLMKAMGDHIIKNGINDKKQLNPLRDKIRKEQFQEHIDALPAVEPKPKERTAATIVSTGGQANAGGRSAEEQAGSGFKDKDDTKPQADDHQDDVDAFKAEDGAKDDGGAKVEHRSESAEPPCSEDA